MIPHDIDRAREAYEMALCAWAERKERARVVAFLRRKGRTSMADVADEIEAGEHLK